MDDRQNLLDANNQCIDDTTAYLNIIDISDRNKQNH